jgi:hypothetical protein
VQCYLIHNNIINSISVLVEKQRNILTKQIIWSPIQIHLILIPFCSFLSFYSLVNQTMTDISPGLARRIFHEALAVWSKSSNLNFREVNDPNADIQIMFAKWVIFAHIFSILSQFGHPVCRLGYVIVFGGFS